MSSRAMVFPSGTVMHLPAADLAAASELGLMARLEQAGVKLGVVILPSAIEDAYYRFNNLPPRLIRLYDGLDPLDPDEDIVEEAEQAAMRLLGEAYLLDDLIDAIYASLSALPQVVEVRRPGAGGVTVTGARAALLAVKRTFRDDWTTPAVLSRLSVSGRLGVEARPVIVHASLSDAALDAVRHDAVGHDAVSHDAVSHDAVGHDAVTRQVHAVVGTNVSITLDQLGRVTRVLAADALA